MRRPTHAALDLKPWTIQFRGTVAGISVSCSAASPCTLSRCASLEIVEPKPLRDGRVDNPLDIGRHQDHT